MPLQILLVEDNPGDARLVRAQLSSASNGDFVVEHAKRLSEGLSKLSESGADVVLLDLNLPDSHGLETFTTVYAHAPEIPIIVLSGLDDRNSSVQAVRGGAQDYIVKGLYDGEVLSRAISYAIERKKSELKIKQALEEKTILLKEIHHRVKNNLQIIASLVSLQMDKIKDESVREIFRPCQDRIVAMGLVHNELYAHEDLSVLNITECTKILSTKLSSAYNDSSCAVSIQYDCEIIYISVDLAIPYCLILTEVVTNAFKHAFQGKAYGEIVISLHKTDEFINLKIRDNGVGLPSGFTMNKSDSLGLQLITGLVNQIHGSIEIKDRNGTVVDVRFPLTRTTNSETKVNRHTFK